MIFCFVGFALVVAYAIETVRAWSLIRAFIPIWKQPIKTHDVHNEGPKNLYTNYIDIKIHESNVRFHYMFWDIIL